MENWKTIEELSNDITFCEYIEPKSSIKLDDNLTSLINAIDNWSKSLFKKKITTLNLSLMEYILSNFQIEEINNQNSNI